MLDNLDFDGQIDYTPYINIDKVGNQKFNEFMSGNFAWRHAVSHVLPYNSGCRQNHGLSGNWPHQILSTVLFTWGCP